jgi:hypothetical protein
MKHGQFRLFLTLATLTEHDANHTVTIALRDLCKLALIATSVFPEALKALEERSLVLVRHGGKHHQSAYKVNFWETICASKFDAPTPIGAPKFDAPVPLFSMHSASEFDAPTTPIPRARETSNSDQLPNSTLDRVFKSEVKDFEKTTLEYFGRRLHAYMAKFGRRDDGRLFIETPGYPPPPPDKPITARFLAIDTPQTLALLLDNLTADACKAYALRPNQENAFQPRRYSWFVTTALNNIHGIHWRQTAQATADWHVHKRGERQPAPPATEAAPDPEFSAELIQQAVAGAKTLR